MEQNEMKMIARLTFVADKVVRNMKKCLEKKDPRYYVKYPAIEPETGVMIATNGKVLAVHKLQDFRCELGDGVFVVNGPRMIPAELTKMKGLVTMEILSNGHDEVTRISDATTATYELKIEGKYPAWRTAIPQSVGAPFTVDAQVWDDALKEAQQMMDNAETSYIHLYGAAGGADVKMSYSDEYTDARWEHRVGVGRMPHKMVIDLNCKRLRYILSFQPTDMRFASSQRPVVATNNDTLLLLMPMYVASDTGYEIATKDIERFNVDTWIAGDKKDETAATPTPAPEPTPSIEERLRRALTGLMAA